MFKLFVLLFIIIKMFFGCVLDIAQLDLKGFVLYTKKLVKENTFFNFIIYFKSESTCVFLKTYNNNPQKIIDDSIKIIQFLAFFLSDVMC